MFPPEPPPPELDVGEGAVAVAVLPDPPFPPAPTAVVEIPLDNEDAGDDRLEDCDDADDDVTKVVGVGVVCAKVILLVGLGLLRLLRVEVTKPLGVCVAESEASTASILDNDDCDAVDCARRELGVPLASELRLVEPRNAVLVLDDVIAGGC